MPKCNNLGKMLYDLPDIGCKATPLVSAVRDSFVIGFKTVEAL
jgi:hypothetical protein